MQNKYYYLVSSLPYLFFDTESPVTTEDFISSCRNWLSRKDFSLLLHHKDTVPVLRKWKKFNNSMKEELSQIRSLKKLHPEEKIHSVFSEIFEGENPLFIEKRYERIRWDFLEGQEFYHTFDINWLLIYLFKLNILERLMSFNKEKGMQVFETHVRSWSAHGVYAHGAHMGSEAI